MWSEDLVRRRRSPRLAPGSAGAQGARIAPGAAERRVEPPPLRVRARAGRRLRVATLILGLLIVSPALARAEILLNELLADPARDWNGNGALSSRDDEWVEIINTGSTTVDLSHFRLAGPDSVWRYEFTGTLAPGQIRLVFGKDSYDWETAHGFPAFGLRMSNTGGELVLFELVNGTPILRDCYAWLDHEAEDDRSSGRGPDGGATWMLYDALNPYTGAEEPRGNGCAPSPGTRQSCATPIEAATWGTLKTLYGTARP